MYINDDPGLTLTYFTARSKLLIVLQTNSQVSVYRTIGPLVMTYWLSGERSLPFRLLVFMPPTLKKWGAYCFRLVRPFVRPYKPMGTPVAIKSPSVQKKFQARVLKFHI